MLLYIAYSNFEVTMSSGIRKKIAGQTNVFQKAFGRAYFTMRAHQTAYLMDGNNVVEKETAVTRQDYLSILIRWIEKYEVERTYIRYPFADMWFVELLRYQKENNIRTVMEIPSYPYDGELSYGRLKVEDVYYRDAVTSWVDVISTYSPGGTIWGKPRIVLKNGIDVSACKLSKEAREKNRLTLIGVSSGMAVWMGYERLLEGLRIYYQEPRQLDIRVKLVGNGDEKDRYQVLASNYGLLDRVDFCGFLSGADLDQVYEQADVAVGSLGFYKVGATIGSPIKGAEYCARGLPMICGCTDTRFPDDTPFVLRVPNDDSPIDIPSVITFYEKLSAQEGFREKIHEYAVQNLAWDRIMKPVIDYLR